MGSRGRRWRAAGGGGQQQQQVPPWGAGVGGPGPRTVDGAEALLLAAAEAKRRRNGRLLGLLLDTLAGCERRLLVDAAAAHLRQTVPALWASGWQPAEVVHQGRRVSARGGRVVAAAVLADHAHRDPRTLHRRWAAQLDAIAAAAPAAHKAAGRPGWLAEHVRREGLDGRDLAAALVDATAALTGLEPLPVILPPPGSSGSAPPPAAAQPAAAAEDPVLAKVRALLAKAESTPYEAEAEALTAKAHELMARHAIDAALVWARRGRDERPVTIRLVVDDPYARAKAMLLGVVAQHTRCRAVLHDRYGLCSVVGFAPDVAAAEVLFTSLLVQSQVAVLAEAAAAPPGSRARSRSFRASFLLAYAARIGERLDAVNRAVEEEARRSRSGGDLLPVLAARADAVDDAVAEQFGPLRAVHTRGPTDAAGWLRGRAAADRAQLDVHEGVGPAVARPTLASGLSADHGT